MSDHRYRGFYIYDQSAWFKNWVAVMQPNYKGPIIRKSFFSQKKCVRFLLNHNVVYEGLKGEGPTE